MKAAPVLGEGIGVETSCDLGRPILIEGDSAKVDAMQLFLAGCCAKTGPGAEEVFCRKRCPVKDCCSNERDNATSNFA